MSWCCLLLFSLAAAVLDKCFRPGGYAVCNYPFLTLKERDIETGLDYFGERYYGSSLGRFTTVDPLGSSMRAANPQTMNRYTYVLNNPLRYVDPDGLEEEDAWNQLTEDERKAMQGKLELKKGETAQQAFNRLVTVDDPTATAANVQSVQNLIAQAGGVGNSETWQHITAITKVTAGASDISEPIGDPSRRESSNVEIKVDDKSKFFSALKSDPINKFSINSLGDAVITIDLWSKSMVWTQSSFGA